MRTTVEKAVAQLTELKSDEKDLRERLAANLRQQAVLINMLQIKPETPPSQAPLARHVVQTAAAARHTTVDKSGAAKVREYLMGIKDDSIITTEKIATDLKMRRTIVSTAMGRLVGSLVERAPGSKRGKFRKLSRAA